MTADYRSLIARTPAEFKSLNGIDVLTGHEVMSVDPAEKSIRVRDAASGREYDDRYDRLLFSTGASAFVPPFEGARLEGVFTVRHLADGLRIKEYLTGLSSRRAVVVGSGPIGLEMCEALRSVGLDVTLVELADRVMPTISADLSRIVQSKLESEGVRCVLGQSVTAIDGSGGLVRSVSTPTGPLEADLVLLGIGVKPVTELAARAGVEMGAGGAIKVDPRMRTNVEDVFAAGDCATTVNTVTGAETWLPLGSTARKQGRVAGENIAGGSVDFPGVQGTAIVKCFDMTVGRTGLDEKEARAAGFDPVVTGIEAEPLHKYYPSAGPLHLQVTADRATGRALGAQVAGPLGSAADKRLDIMAVAVGSRMTVDEMQYMDLAYAPPYSTAIDSPIVIANIASGRIHGTECSCDGAGLDL